MPKPQEPTSNLLKQGLSLAWRRLTLPYRLLTGLAKPVLAGLTLCFFLLSFALPMVTTVSDGVFNLVSTVAETLTARPSVLTRQSRAAEARLANTEAELAAERLAAKDAATKVEAKLAAKETELAAERAAIKEARLAASRAEGKAVGLELRAAELEAKLAGKVEAKVLYRGERRLLSEVVSDTSSTVARRVATTMKADIASMAGQAVPYLGVAVIVSATTYDAYQSCMMVKDLHDLDVAFNPDHAIVDSSEVCGLRVPTASEIWASVKNAPWAALSAARDALPSFDWEAGIKDISGRIPSASEIGDAVDGWGAQVGDWLPDFYLQRGWENLKSDVGLGGGN